MTQFRLTSREVALIETQAKRPASAPLDMSWLPTQQIEDAYNIKDYVMQRVEPPRGSPLGEHSHGVSSAKIQTERDIITFRFEYSLNKTDFRIAGRNGYDIIGQNTAMMRSAMEHSILTLVLQGSGALTSTDLPDISGMLDVGEDVNAALDGEAWATATKPIVHAKAGFDDLKENNYFQVEGAPFEWILSHNLESGLLDLNNAANPRSHGEIINNTFIKGGTYFYQNGTSAYGTGGYKIYPLPPASNDDGLWIAFSNSNGTGEGNFYLAQVTNGIETTVPNVLDENNRYKVEMEWRGTPVFRNATTGSAGSAEYIVFEPDVDLVA